MTQRQRNEYGIGNDYAFDLLLYDAKQTPIGQITNTTIDATTKSISIDSNLPYVLMLTASGGDPDPVQFAYGGDTWSSNDQGHSCNLGNGPANGYQDGERMGDCGFTCN